ncbi:MAG: site-2 protease family protein [Pseudanabaenaceae cyanobacterium bins.68]|nr:site-2 protease family protein [Pseudanabaenaceae cyanobacterium bins.68]
MQTTVWSWLVGAIVLGVIGWSWQRAAKFGQLGLLTWGQQLCLSLPWLVYLATWWWHLDLGLGGFFGLLTISTLGYGLLAYQISNLTQTPSANTPVAIAPISPEHLKLISGIFGIDTFYATEISPYQAGVIVRGNLRADASQVHGILTQALRDRLADQYNLFLTQGETGRAVIYILPALQPTRNHGIAQILLAILLVGVNFSTTMTLAQQILAFNFGKVAQPMAFSLGFMLGINAVIALRELSQRWIARRYQVGLTLPFCLPSGQIASFGTFSRIKTPIPDRQALFDLAIAPVITGGLLSLLLLLSGLALSAIHLGELNLPSQIFRASVLVGLLAKLCLGDSLNFNLVTVHPLVLIGWLGLIITALNLIPAGQLDGGRMFQAIYGRKGAALATLVSLVVLAITTLVNPLALYWGGIILILLRQQEKLILNELTEPESDRDLIALAAWFLMLAVLLPFTTAAATMVGIG